MLFYERLRLLKRLELSAALERLERFELSEAVERLERFERSETVELFYLNPSQIALRSRISTITRVPLE